MESLLSEHALTAPWVIRIGLALTFQDYSEIAVAYRPSHADATYDFKYGVRAIQVSGQSCEC